MWPEPVSYNSQCAVLAWQLVCTNLEAEKMTATTSRTYVLVHGAGHGAWAWKRVRRILREYGHEVFTPTLTGVGERSHLMSRDITLDTHILDVVNLFEWEDIGSVVLVGHSYAGWVISGAAESIGDRLSGIVYLDAFLPEDGQRPFDIMAPAQQQQFAAALERGEISRPGPTSAMLKIQRADDAVWVDSEITPHPLAVSMQPVALSGALDRVAGKLYVRTPLLHQPAYDAALARCQAAPDWKTAVIHETGHDPHIDRPEAVCALLEGMS